MDNNWFIKTGTAGGTLTVILLNISTGDLIKTVILAVIGTIVSVTVSHLLRFLFKRNKRQ